MALEETLAKVAQDEAAGDLGTARDRLEGLRKTYPDDLEVRRRLGAVYWLLRYPEHAGPHWYLLPSENPDMDNAKAVFARRCGHDPRCMITKIGYRGGMEALAGTYAEGVLETLAREARMHPDELRQLVKARREADRPSGQDKQVV